MQERVRLAWWGLGISIGCHATALGFYLIAPGYETLPARFTAQFLAFVALSAFGSCVIVVSRSSIAKGAIILFKVVVVNVLSFPMTNGNAVPVLLAITLVTELIINVRRSLGVWICSAFVALFGTIRLMSLGWVPEATAGDALESVAFPVLILLCVGLVTELARRYREQLSEQAKHIERLDSAVQQLSEANIGFQRYADFIAERSTADERNRITREVHDTTIYALTNLKMMIEAGRYMAADQSQKLKELLSNAYIQAREGIENTRSALRALRTINERGLGNYKAIQRIAEAYYAATGVEVEIEYGNLPRETRPEIDRFMYRFVQEGMTNAFRHGRATRILVLFWIHNETLTVSLQDNGRGAASVNEGIGLRGMRERVGEIGGELDVQNLQSGFKLVVRIPYIAEGGNKREVTDDESGVGGRPSALRR